mmetsp:Transcript_4821/g.15594  ORF Transcript_4821/g.15594 Transcript_4821/m.15594 type:complete len:209 (-) Transcript_4821:167-793(-)
MSASVTPPTEWVNSTTCRCEYASRWRSGWCPASSASAPRTRIASRHAANDGSDRRRCSASTAVSGARRATGSSVHWDARPAWARKERTATGSQTSTSPSPVLWHGTHASAHSPLSMESRKSRTIGPARASSTSKVQRIGTPGTAMTPRASSHVRQGTVAPGGSVPSNADGPAGTAATAAWHRCPSIAPTTDSQVGRCSCKMVSEHEAH